MAVYPTGVLADYLAAQSRVWVRLAAIRLEDDWRLALLEVAAPEPPPSWRRQRWTYERAVFVAYAPAGATIAKWLARERIALPSLSISVPLNGSVAVERRSTNFQGSCEPVPWPSREWRVHVRDNSARVLSDQLVAADAPAFISFEHAAAEFFGISPEPGRNFAGCEIIVREQDRRARIDRVRVRPTEIVVGVSGEQLRGTSLKLSGIDGPGRRLSSRTREVRLPVLGSLGAGAWLALHRDRELLDQRILDPAWRANDVDIEIDESTRLEALISGGEQATVEFKRQLPDADANRVMKTVAAFANGAGGTVLFGVENDGAIVGVEEPTARQSCDRLTNLIRDWVHPLPDFTCLAVDVAGCCVVVIHVASGGDAPYGVGTSERDIRYYVRRAGTTFPAKPSDVRAFVHARVATAPAPRFRSRRR